MVVHSWSLLISSPSMGTTIRVKMVFRRFGALVYLFLCSILIAPAVVHGQCTICGGSLPFPTREVFLESGTTTCAGLEEAAQADSSLCPDLPQYAFYCGCPGVESSCTLCPSGDEVPFPNLELKGFEPSWFPSDVPYTCRDAQNWISLLQDEEQCSEIREEEMELVYILCGCFVVDGNAECTTLCPDGTLIDPEFLNAEALVDQPDYGTFNCGEYQVLAAEGDLTLSECSDAMYVGVRKCGCAQTNSFCDLCVGESPVPNLARQITADRRCLEWAGVGFRVGATTETCDALQHTMGIYCGCDNEDAVPADACRICDAPGGAVVPAPRRRVTIDVDGTIFDTECSELEFNGNRPSSSAFSCEEVTDFGQETCCADFSPPPTPPTSRPTPTTPLPTSRPTPLPPTPAPTSRPTPRPTPRPTARQTPPPTSRPTPPPTRRPTPDPTREPTKRPTPAPNPKPTPDPTQEPTRKPTPEPTRATKEPTLEPTRRPTPRPTPAPNPKPTPDPTLEPTRKPTPRPTPAPNPKPTPDPTLEPTRRPTPQPTRAPNPKPTTEPTLEPTMKPTAKPTERPTPPPPPEPTMNPTPDTPRPTPLLDVSDRPTPEDTTVTNQNPHWSERYRNPRLFDNDPSDCDGRSSWWAYAHAHWYRHHYRKRNIFGWWR